MTRRRVVGTSQRAMVVVSTIALALGAVGWFGATAAGAASAGNGTMSVAPTSVTEGSTTNQLSFLFTNNSGSTFSNGSAVTVTVPAGWTAPSQTSSNVGFVSASGSCNSLDTTPSVSGSGPWTITIAQRCTNGQSFTLVYGANAGSTHVTAPTAAGSYQFTAASQNGGGSFANLTAGSPSVTVNPGAASQVVFTTQPGATSAVAGATWTSEPVVKVEDANNNVETGLNSGSVTLSIAGGTPQAAFTSGTATINVASGVATFTNLVVNTTGSYTLTATPNSIAGTSAVNSSAFTVSAAAENKLVVTTPPANPTTAGANISLAVTIEDTFGNTVTSPTAGFNDTLAASLTSGSFAAGSTTSVAASAGVATFGNLQITSTANSPYTIHIVDSTHGTVTAVNTNSFTLAPAVAAKFVITSSTFTATAAATATHAMTAVLQDQFNNVTTSPTALTVNLSSTSAGASFATSSGGSPVTSVNLPANTSTVNFFYGDTVAGGPTVTVSATGVTTSGTQGETIQAAAANKLAFGLQPSDTAVAATMSPVTVQVQDQFGNPVAGAGVSITLAPSSGTISSGNNTNTLASGLATFSAIKINTATANLTLSASSSLPNGSGPSGSFTIYVPVSNSSAALTDTASDTGSGVLSVAYYYCAGYSGSCDSSSGTLIGSSTTAAGNFAVTWTSQPANGPYRLVSVGVDNVTNTSLASASIPVNVFNQQSQTISFTSTPPAAGKIGNTYPVSATATSGLPVGFSLDGSSTGCTLATATVTFTAVGTCKIDANQAGNASFTAAPQVQQSITVLGPLTITSVTSTNAGSITPGSSTQSIAFNNPLNPATVPTSGTMTLSMGCFIVCGNTTLSIAGVTNGALDVGTASWVKEANAFGTNTISYAVTMTLSSDQKTVTIAVGACSANCTNTAAGASGTYKFVAASGIADIAGNSSAPEKDITGFKIF